MPLPCSYVGLISTSRHLCVRPFSNVHSRTLSKTYQRSFLFYSLFFKTSAWHPFSWPFSFLLLTLLALTRYVTVARLFYDNALALTLLSVALYRLCQFLSMFFSLGNVVLRSGLILCRQCFPDCGYSISSIVTIQ